MSTLSKQQIRSPKRKLPKAKTSSFSALAKKGRDALRKSEFEISKDMAGQMGSYDFSLANSIGLDVINAYLEGEADEVILIFGEFISMVKQEPVVKTILPMGSQAGAEEGEEASSATEYIYEPDVMGLLAELLPRFIKVQIYRGMLDTSASEHAARMAAMDNATRACDDMISSLTQIFNKTRQTAITTELMDIVGGAEALKG